MIALIGCASGSVFRFLRSQSIPQDDYAGSDRVNRRPCAFIERDCDPRPARIPSVAVVVSELHLYVVRVVVRPLEQRPGEGREVVVIEGFVGSRGRR